MRADPAPHTSHGTQLRQVKPLQAREEILVHLSFVRHITPIINTPKGEGLDNVYYSSIIAWIIGQPDDMDV